MSSNQQMWDQTGSSEPRQARDCDVEDVEYQLAPPVGKSREEIMLSEVRPELLRLATALPPPPKPKSQIQIQFSLRQLLALTTFASIGLATARWMPSKFFIFFGGMIILGLIGWSWKQNANEPIARLTLWGSVTVYFAAIVACHLAS